MAAEQDFAEGRRPGETWQDLIRRQQKELDDKEDGNGNKLLRSLPNEQQQNKGRGVSEGYEQHTADRTFDDMIREASERSAPDQQMEMER